MPPQRQHTYRPSAALLTGLCWLLLTMSMASPLATAAPAPLPEPANYVLPDDMSRVHFYLLTVDVGNNVWDNFGHTALRVYDENTNTDTVFNWGGFDTRGGVVTFAWNFFKGIMNYSLGTHTPAQEFAIYRAQGRSVWQDKINLTNPQKEILYRRLLWNLEPGNVLYPYHYFLDNCTTRVRDYLDEALGGEIAAHNAGITDVTYRESVLVHYRSLSLIEFSLDILMNSNIDRPMSEWGSMYLPLQLRERLQQMPSTVARNGERVMLLSDPQTILDFDPPVEQVSPYRVASTVLVAPVLFLLLLLKRIPMSYFATHSRIGLKAAGISYRLLGVLGLLTATFSGVYGLMMLGSWFVSDHLDLHHNINLLLFWPTDLMGILVALRWILFCKPWPMTHNSMPFINYYLLAHVLGAVAYLLITAFDLVLQSTLPIALYVLPGFLLYTLLIWLVGFEPAKPRNMFF